MVRITPDGTRISGLVRRNTFRAATDDGGLKLKRRDCFAPRPIAGRRGSGPAASIQFQDTSIRLVLRITVTNYGDGAGLHPISGVQSSALNLPLHIWLELEGENHASIRWSRAHARSDVRGKPQPRMSLRSSRPR